MKTILKTFLLIVLFIGCETVKNVAQKETQKTEKEHIVKYVDTVFVTPKSTAKISIPKKIFVYKTDTIHQTDTIYKTKTIKYRQGNAVAKVIIKKDTVFVYAECDTIKIKAKIRRELIRELKENNTNKEATETKKKGISIWVFIISIIASFSVGYFLSKVF